MKNISAYAAAGVNIALGDALKSKLPQLVARTRQPGCLGKIGGFGGLFELDTKKYRRPVLVSSADGVGTKLKIAIETGIPVCQTQVGSMGCLFFHEGPIRNYAEAAKSDTARYARFFQGMLERGVYLAPSQFEACFTSTAHTAKHLDQTLTAAREVFRQLA